MDQKIKSYHLSPQLKAEVGLAKIPTHKGLYVPKLPRLGFLKDISWKKTIISALVFAAIIGGYIGVKKTYEYLAWKSGQERIAQEKAYENHLAQVKSEVSSKAGDAYAFAKMSQDYLKNNDGEKAVVAAKIAVEKDPNWRDGYLNLGQIYLATNDFEKAQATLEIAKQKDPLYGQTYYLLSLAYQEVKNDAAAKQAFAKAKELGFDSEIGG